MAYTASALVLTVLMGGIIAYNGDLIGRKFGKRRLTIFGLRPKHTAILITTITGVFISGLTTGTLFLVVPPVRDVILRGEQAIRQNRGLQAEIEEARKRADTFRIEQAEQSRKLGVVLQDLSEAGLKLSGVETDLHATRQALTSEKVAVADLKAAGRRLNEVNRRLVASNRTLLKDGNDLKAQLAALSEASTGLRDRNKRLQEQNVKFTEENQLLSRQKSSFEGQNLELQNRNQKLLAGNRDLEDEQKRIEDKLRPLLDQRANLELAIEGLEKTNKKLASEKTLLETIALEAFGKHQTLTGMFEAMRTRRVAIHGGEDLARTIVPSDCPPEKVREILLDLLHSAGLAAIGKGAAPGDSARAVQIVDKEFFTRIGDRDLTVRVTEEDRIRGMVNRLSRNSQPVCVLALAVANSVEQEPAAIDFQPFVNRMVYRKGQLVAERIVETDRSVAALAGELISFLKGVGRVAMERGMIPTIDPATGEPHVSQINMDELVSLLEQVRGRSSRVRIRSFAREDTMAADSLSLRFLFDAAL